MRFAKNMLLVAPVLIGALLTLNACVSRSDSVVAVNTPMVTAAAALPAAGPRIVNRIVVSGKPTAVDHLYALSRDCTPLDYTIRIEQQPSHGTVVIKDIQNYSNFPATNPRSTCNNTKVAGHEFEYTSTANYTGSDFLVINIFSDEGQMTEEKVLITVK